MRVDNPLCDAQAETAAVPGAVVRWVAAKETIEHACDFFRGDAEKLVQRGIFAHCRNPLYVGTLRFNWRRLVTAEYGSAYVWLAVIILVTLKNLWLNGEYQPGHSAVWSLWVLFCGCDSRLRCGPVSQEKRSLAESE